MFLVVIILLVTILSLAGCGNNVSITAEEFKSTMIAKGYTVTEATSQFDDYDYIEKVYIAVSSDMGYQIEFYEMTDADSASYFFNYNKSIFESAKSSMSTETSTSFTNNAKYTLTTNGMYKVVSRINNTVIYLNVKDSYKDVVKQVLDNLNY